MRISLPGLGSRLRRARKQSGLSQEAVAEQVGVSWMTVLRWEHSQRAVSDDVLQRLSKLYDRPLRWFLTLEEGDLEEWDIRYGQPVRDYGKVAERSAQYRASREEESPSATRSEVAERMFRRISEAPAGYLPLIERVVEDILDGLQSKK